MDSKNKQSFPVIRNITGYKKGKELTSFTWNDGSVNDHIRAYLQKNNIAFVNVFGEVFAFIGEWVRISHENRDNDQVLVYVEIPEYAKKGA